MIISYSLVSVAVIMFSFMFFFNSVYEKNSGNSTRAVLFFSGGSYIVGLIILFFINKFKFQPTPFSLIVSAFAAIDLMLYSFCSIKSFSKINLSLYSVFAMLGGMVIPFISAILFFNEKLTISKIVCFVLIIVAMFFTVEKDKGKGGAKYYAGIFVFNGLYGVIAKFHQSAPYPKANEACYSMLISMWVILICAVLLIFNKDRKLNFNKKSFGSIVGNGIFNNIGNLLLLFSLQNLPASAQYPFVTGGTMIISTVICFFTPKKPNKKEITAVIISFIGLLSLCLFN